MSQPAAQSASTSHRRRLLRELGMVPWVLRQPLAADAPTLPLASTDAMAAATGAVDCVVVLPQGCSGRELDLLGRALTAAGARLARAPRLTVKDDQLAGPLPEARAYLVLGQAQAHALGRSLSAELLQRAQIVLADEPARVLSEAQAKQTLWRALRTVRRALVGAG